MNRATCRYVLLAMVGLGISMASSQAFAQGSKPDCQCRAPGGNMHDLGTVQCVDIAGRSKLLRCTMSTNTPYWEEIESSEGCPAA